MVYSRKVPLPIVMHLNQRCLLQSPVRLCLDSTSLQNPNDEKLLNVSMKVNEDGWKKTTTVTGIVIEEAVMATMWSLKSHLNLRTEISGNADLRLLVTLVV